MKNSTKQHYEAIADFGCILCHYLGHPGTPCEIHHIRRLGGRRDLAPVIGLCPEHHRGDTGVHGLGNKGFVKRYEVTQEYLQDLTEHLLKRRDESQTCR